MAIQEQKIGVATATIIGMNAMIGASIFMAPAKLGSFVGPAGIVTFAFVICSVWFLAFSFARLAQLFPEEGSFYVYTKQWAGHVMGLVAGGAYVLGIAIAMGLVAQLAGIYLHDYLPSISAQTLGMGIIIFLTILNLLGGILSRASQMISICCTAIPLAAITIICFTKASLSNLTPFAPHGVAAIFRAASSVIFGFFGFESTVSLFSIVENPQQNVPRALSNAIILVSSIYFLFIFSIMLAVPASYFTDPAIPVTHQLALIFPNYSWLISIVHLSILSSFFGVLNAMIWATSSLLSSLLKKVQNPLIVSGIRSGKINEKICILIMAGVILLSYVALKKNISLFFDLTSVCILFAFICALIALFVTPSERTIGRMTQTVMALLSAGMIFSFALEGVITQLMLASKFH